MEATFGHLTNNKRLTKCLTKHSTKRKMTKWNVETTITRIMYLEKENYLAAK